MSGKAARSRTGLAGLAQSLSLSGFETRSTTIRTIIINVMFIGAVAVVLPIFIAQFGREQVIIEPVSVPETLSARGLTAEVAASRLWDGLSDVAARASTAKQSLDALPQARKVEFSFPDSGFSLESLVFHARKLFGAYETRISGEFICADADCAPQGLTLRLRVIRDTADIIDLPPMGEKTERAYFEDAALGVTALLDPFTALATETETAPLKAAALARRLIRTAHPDAKWAHNLIGVMRLNSNDLPAAADEFRAANALDPDFVLSWANLGAALAKSGDSAGAAAAFQKAEMLDPANVWSPKGMADAALAKGDAKEAVRLMLVAASRDPASPRFLAEAGRIALGAGETQAGIAHLRSALELDPGYAPASAALALHYFETADYASAEPVYRDAADYAPMDAEAQAAHGMILMILKDWQAALARYERAIALMPDNGAWRLERAIALERLGKNAEALEELARALPLSPGNAAIQMSFGDNLRMLGRKEDAIAAYRKYLEMEKEAPMRSIAEAWIRILEAG